jgi:nucleoid-associated protein EbfC
MANMFGKKKEQGGGFPGLGGGGNMGGMAAMIQQVQKKMYEDAEKMAERLDAARIDGSAGGGSVKSVVDGNGKLMSITIDPSVLEDKDAEMLQDLVLTAVNAALDKAAEQRESEQQKLMPAGLNIPGLF